MQVCTLCDMRYDIFHATSEPHAAQQNRSHLLVCRLHLLLAFMQA
jgi:hypothetical protein